MEKDIGRLKQQAIEKGEDGHAAAIINGYTVSVAVITGYRNRGAKQKPRLQWKVNGKVVAKDSLRQALIA